IACDKSVALREDDIVDFLDKMTIASPIKLMNLNKIGSITYILKPTEDTKKLDIPTSLSQLVETMPDGIAVTVRPKVPAGPIAFPYKGDNPEALEALKPTDYLQSDNEVIINLAKNAVSGTDDAAVAARRIEAFVDGFITKKDLSVGYASAAEVAKSRQGDCTEHAVLAAAMCRAAGIPARVVCGVVYADSFLSKQNIFGGHMWTEVWLGDGWYGLDATRSGEGGFGAGHIALAYGSGDPIDFFGLVNTLGCFKITHISVTAKSDAAQPEPLSVRN
ncbi:MAG TPA: transglutaminase-like domain-containing protein, partial [Anaerohalosphaeraceae bacterium]|nr:transglutaminase-like domain-containing protein [Anaerohalosphaeraceae bacterium]